MKQFSSFNCMIRHKYGFLRDSKFESVVCMDLFPVFFNGMYCGIMVMADNGKRKDGIYGEYIQKNGGYGQQEGDGTRSCRTETAACTFFEQLQRNAVAQGYGYAEKHE